MVVQNCGRDFNQRIGINFQLLLVCDFNLQGRGVQASGPGGSGGMVFRCTDGRGAGYSLASTVGAATVPYRSFAARKRGPMIIWAKLITMKGKISADCLKFASH